MNTLKLTEGRDQSEKETRKQMIMKIQSKPDIVPPHLAPTKADKQEHPVTEYFHSLPLVICGVAEK